MESVIDLATQQAQQQGAEAICRICLNVGVGSGVVPEALEFAFEIVARGTLAETAQLEIQLIPVRCFCQHCQQSFQPESFVYECPYCHYLSNQILQGSRLELTSLEVF